MTTPKPDAYRNIHRPEMFVAPEAYDQIKVGLDADCWEPVWLHTSPPVPEPTPEPSELGTVVQDCDGWILVRGRGPAPAYAREHWFEQERDRWLVWEELTQPVTILHPGWSGETDD